MSEQNLIPGHADAKGTRAYVKRFEGELPDEHFSEFLRSRMRLSSIGVGTFPGDASAETDANVAAIVSRALQNGINVIDTAAHYRYGRALAAVGAGVRDAHARGIPREGMYLISKGGFLTFRGGKPEDFDGWFAQEVESQGIGTRDDLANEVHLISPEYINYQIELSRSLMGVETLDAFLVDQPEVHIPLIGKERLNQKLEQVFTVLERAVADNRIRCYGLSTFHGARVETDDPLFQSLTSMQALAERAAQAASGNDSARHHFRILMLPFNQVMLEGFTRFNVATGEGNVASTIQAAHQLRAYIVASHTMLKGHLAGASAEVVERSLPDLSPARRAIQFNRSTPGLGTTLVGMSEPEHLDDALAVAAMPPLEKKAFLSMFKKADEG